MNRDADADETEGRALYRASANKLADAQVNMAKRPVKLKAPSDALLMMEMLVALKIAEKAVDDCLQMRSHLNYAALRQIRAVIAMAEGRDAE